MGINEEIAKAFGAHGAWKTRIVQAIDSGRSEHEPEIVAVDNRCAFGKWLYDPSMPGEVRDSEEYRTVVHLHAEFHKAAGATLAKALGGDQGGARRELEGGTYARAAEALSAAMIRWQRNAATECSGHRPGLWRSICFLWKGSVAARIWGAVAIPTLVALATAGMFDARLAETAIGTGRMERATALLAEITATVQEAQKERGLSAAAATGADPQIAAKRKAQIVLTDRRRREMETQATAILAEMPPEVAARWRAATSGLTAIDTLRSKLDAGGMAPAAVAAGYTEQIAKLIGFEEAATTLAVRPEVARDMAEVLRISRAKEAAGQERAVGAAAIVGGQLAPPLRERLTELRAEQQSLFNSFLDAATPAQRQQLERSLADPALADFAKFRAALAAGDLSGLGAAIWFDAATARIDRLHALEDGLLAEIRDAAHAHNLAAWRQMELFSALIAIALVIGGALVFVLTRGITRPVLRLTEAMRQLAAGQSRLEVPATTLPDEIGEMARAVLVFQQQALTVEQMTAEGEAQRRTAEATRRDSLAAMADTIEGRTGEVVARVAEESGRVNDTAGRMAKSAIRVEENASRVAAAAEQSLANAQAVAGASEELSASIREIAAQVERSRDIVGDAVRAADSASSTVGQLAEAMAAIDEVVRVIADIASQTNLLALNATIEAARAGEAGKGFAVVAHEVKNLANQTAKQTEDITSRITTLKDMAERVTAAIAGVVAHIQGVEEIAGSVAAAVEEQDAATKEISRNVQQSAQAAEEVTHRIVEVAEDATATGRQAAMVETLLEAMAEQVTELGHVLTQVVRTATPDVDRRGAERVPMALNFRGRIGGTEIAGQTVDLSVGGAVLATAEAAVTAGASGEIDLDGVGRLVTRVQAVGPLGAHVRFPDAGPAIVRAIETAQRRTKEQDGPYAAIVAEVAAKVAAGFEQAVAQGRIREDELFDADYQPIGGTDPLQVLARHTDLADRVVGPLIDPPLAQDRRIVFCCVCDRNGYIATHNRKFSEPQRKNDRAWNADHCRNRRIFDDRASMAAARNTQPGFSQTYPRDTGDGVTVLKEFDAPIFIGGRHWGAVRLGVEMG